MNRREALTLLAAAPASALEFQSRFEPTAERVWIGPEYWANPLQDWQLRNGRIECVVPGGERNVFLLTHDLTDKSAAFEMRVKCGNINPAEPGREGFVGFRAGIRGRYNDYRDDAVYGIGMNAGVTADGRLFIGKPDPNLARIVAALDFVELRLRAEPLDSGYKVRLTALDKAGVALADVTRNDVPGEWLRGGVALVCHSGVVRESPDPASMVVTMSGLNRKHSERGGNMRFWFSDWRVSGDKFAVHEDRAWGPILFAMHTISRGVMKLTAQIAPTEINKKSVKLEVKSAAGAWKQVASSPIDKEARTATFRVAAWDDRRDTAYRLGFDNQTFEGIVRKDPREKDKLVVGGLSCTNDLGFPHSEIVRGLKHFHPDILLFTGDQIYERVGGYGIQRAPIEIATLDYLRKWMIFGWAFGDVMRDTPAVCMPDDHDVFHGNVWGAGGRHSEGAGQPGQDSGGYTQPAP
ncbi:MAG: hypothetical protein H7039_04005, partial [Bryobacteraceae bacterium]|nr:hypothetical protein [Bryobacteraceae bacterium]